MFRVGDNIKLNSYYPAAVLPKGTPGVVRRIRSERSTYKGVPIPQLLWVKFIGTSRITGVFDYRLVLSDSQLQFKFMYE